MTRRLNVGITTGCIACPQCGYGIGYASKDGTIPDTLYCSPCREDVSFPEGEDVGIVTMVNGAINIDVRKKQI